MLRGPWNLLLILAVALLGALGPLPRALAADIDVKLMHFGVGDVARGGAPLALQIEFRSALPAVAEIEVVLELPNADLDIAEFSRSFVLNPGQMQRRWIYGLLPPTDKGALSSAVFELRLYERSAGRRVRDLGTARIGPAVSENAPRILAPEEDAILVVGTRTLGLDAWGPVQQAPHPAMHLATLIANVRDADALPDRWEGLSTFGTVIWSSGSIAPSRLNEDSARALTGWIERGGHLVIAIPSAGDPWAIGAKGVHPLSGILPPDAPRRVEGVRVRDMIQFLSVRDELRDPDARIRLSVFDAKSLKDGWRPLVAVPARRNPDGTPVLTDDGPDGSLVGIQRSVGFGRVTVLGIDVDELAARSLQTPPIPQADVFWNRVLARRADAPSQAELDQLTKADRLAGSGGYAHRIELGDTVSSQIGLAGQAALGVLAATAVFALYWLLAGPLGFALLKSAGRERWSWVVYVAVAAVFSVAIWLIGSSLAGRQPRIQHMTVLDMVEPAQGEADLTRTEHKRATGWFSLFAPRYGTIEVALDPEGDAALRNRIASWRSPTADAIGFPSRERYAAPLDEPSKLTVPSRATSIDFETHWLGAVDPKWGLMPRATVPVSVEIDRSASPPTISIKGELLHTLPSTLRDVQVIHVWPVRNPLQTLGPDGSLKARRFQGQLPNRGAMVIVSEWQPGTALDLAKTLQPWPISDRGLQSTLTQRYYDALYSAARNFGQDFGVGSTRTDPTRTVELLALYSMLPPPPYIKDPPASPKIVRISRDIGRELDLSAWFTEPCIIVMGRLDDVPLPYPVTVDGESVASNGSVFVRWVLPLPGDPDLVVPERIVPVGEKDAIRDGAGQAGQNEDEAGGEPGAQESPGAGAR